MGPEDEPTQFSRCSSPDKNINHDALFTYSHMRGLSLSLDDCLVKVAHLCWLGEESVKVEVVAKLSSKCRDYAGKELIILLLLWCCDRVSDLTE